MLLIDTWGSLGDDAREEALYTRKSMGTKCPIVIAAAAAAVAAVAARALRWARQ